MNISTRGSGSRIQTTDKDKATTVESQPQNKGTGVGANTPSVSQDAAEEPIMSRSDEARESKPLILKLAELCVRRCRSPVQL